MRFRMKFKETVKFSLLIIELKTLKKSQDFYNDWFLMQKFGSVMVKWKEKN